MSESQGKRIAVIGGGAAGAAVVAELLALGASALQIYWFAGREHGRGVAYGTRRPEHVLNVRAALMGLLDTDAGDFVRFLEPRLGTVAPTAFVARSLFGDFIEATIQRLLESKHRPALLIHEDRATALTPLVTRWRIQSGTEQREVDEVVLATGALPSRPLPQVADSALSGGRYLLDPWRLHDLEMEPPQRVLIIGSRLTAIDAMLTASKRWPQAEITALSRHGLLPFAHTALPMDPYPGQHKLIEDLESLPDIRRWIALLRETAAQEEVDPRALIDGLRGVTNRLWGKLDVGQRGRFLRHARWLWDALRHRTPPATGEAIEALRTSGRLTVTAGRVRAIQGERPRLTYRRRVDGSEHSFTADLAVQATGFESTQDTIADPLLAQLTADGILHADPLGLGWCANAEGCALSSEGSPATGLWIIGVMLRGALWESASMPEIRAFAGKLVRTVLAN